MISIKLIQLILTNKLYVTTLIYNLSIFYEHSCDCINTYVIALTLCDYVNINPLPAADLYIVILSVMHNYNNYVNSFILYNYV